MMLWLLGGSYLATCAALILVGIWEARRTSKKGKATMERERRFCTHCFVSTQEELRHCWICGAKLWVIPVDQEQVYERAYRKIALETRMHLMLTDEEADVLIQCEDRLGRSLYVAVGTSERAPVPAPSSPKKQTGPLANTVESVRQLQFLRYLVESNRLTPGKD